ncbi:bifunctional glycosyltransferase/CDP-glycerol:glycerophosphate glycerophosphotransferase [Nonomuraea endophytica]|uniref:CDP-glycerol glycerophosphotransferase n=1 Tax=Nonomuraea endophytica TaxID=714136 RepID=A0A7W7ZWC2_9ACTN|nr:bifunctional glycosyltransferase family 2 protein/CDP-glycerol:glycerophosphate glycerophosphotransferase [Nonomuraea endophytica]MBB5074999.1 CDP-glycerol glycerophosphotransferase [Nonomuraea endophytica]
MTPALSVVVPFHNVEPYLEHCLSSLAAQEFPDLEVICVDDGSSDLSPVIAKDFAGRDRRFTLLQQQHSGPGPARNAGIALATGRLLAFADGDDYVPPEAYSTLIESLERTGSDLACGNVCCFDSVSTWRSPLHADMFAATVERTHVSRMPVLMTDRTVWNKVYRRAFWDAAELAFPAGYYEDTPVAVPAHVLADTVDVLNTVVYHWRQRDSGTRSITQSRRERGHLEDRVSTIETMRAFLGRDHEALLPLYDQHVLQSDLVPFLKAFEFADARCDDYRERLFDRLEPLLAAIPRGVSMSLPWLERLAYHLVRTRDADELTRLLTHRRTGRAFAVRRRWPNFYVDHPLRRKGGVPARLFRVRPAELTLLAQADRVSEAGAGFRVAGHAYFEGLDTAGSKIRLWLQPGDGRRVEVPVRRVSRPDVSEAHGCEPGVYDDSGFEADLDVTGLWTPASSATTWEVQVEVRNGRAHAELPLALPARVLPAQSLNRWLSRSAKVETIRSKGHLVVRARAVRVVAESCADLPGGLELRGRVFTAVRTGELTAADTTTRLPVEFERGKDGTGFRVLIPHDAGFSGAVWLESGKERFKIFAAEHWADGSGATPGGERWLSATRTGALTATSRERRPAVLSAEWSDARSLTLRGHYRGTARPEGFRLERTGGGGVHELPVTWEGQNFTVELDPDAMPVFGQSLPLAPGTWQLTAATDAGRAAVGLTNSALREAGAEVTVGAHDLRLQSDAEDTAELRVRAVAATGKAALQRALEKDYPRLRALPVLDLAVFESWEGRQYSDNPRAIYEELRRRGDARECVWVTADGRFEPPPGARTVLSGSAAHVEALARAALIVSNDCAPEWFVAREGQKYVQTWHGTPLKTIGFDARRHTFPAAVDYARRLADDVARWDLLLSPSPYCSEVFRRAFGYRGEIAEVGQPRNDQLRRPPAEGLRERLGVPPGKKTILYAPTWRDDEIGRGDLYRMNLMPDLAEMREGLGDDHVLLVRAHSKAADAMQPLGEPGFAIDVSAYPEMAHLLGLADVFVTDYSAALFDFAVTGRPMVFFAPDLANYRDHVRGLYLDYADGTPGPVAATTGELVAAVRAAEIGYDAAFLEKYCPLDDGQAAARAVDRILG